MNKYTEFDIDSKKIVVCVVESGKKYLPDVKVGCWVHANVS